MLAVFDVDGVVADVRHRLHHLDRTNRRGYQDWGAFFRAAGRDPLLPEGAALVHDLAREHDIVWLTGRPDWLRRTTLSWFEEHGLPTDELHMRPDHDYRPARLYKIAALRRLKRRGIAAFVDDDPEVVSAAQADGFPVALADWVPRDDPFAEVLREAQEQDGRT